MWVPVYLAKLGAYNTSTNPEPTAENSQNPGQPKTCHLGKGSIFEGTEKDRKKQAS